jgi:hypothetical protein
VRYFILGFLLSTLLVGCSPQSKGISSITEPNPPLAADWIQVKNPMLGFDMQLPPDWYVHEFKTGDAEKDRMFESGVFLAFSMAHAKRKSRVILGVRVYSASDLGVDGLLTLDRAEKSLFKDTKSSATSRDSKPIRVDYPYGPALVHDIALNLQSPTEEIPPRVRVALLTTATRLYILMMIHPPEESDLDNTFEAILRAFRPRAIDDSKPVEAPKDRMTQIDKALGENAPDILRYAPVPPPPPTAPAPAPPQQWAPQPGQSPQPGYDPNQQGDWGQGQPQGNPTPQGDWGQGQPQGNPTPQGDWGQGQPQGNPPPPDQGGYGGGQGATQGDPGTGDQTQPPPG